MSPRISIDPGQRSGYAIWDGSTWNKLVPPVKSGRVNARKLDGEDWHMRVEEVVRSFQIIFEEHEPSHLYIEWMQFHDTAGGHAIAKNGGLLKLVYLVGRLAQVARDFNANVVLCPVNRWKGQLPKAVVNKRIVRKLGKTACSEFKADAWDAVGIGLWAKGFF